jgi:hypothetical protein
MSVHKVQQVSRVQWDRRDLPVCKGYKDLKEMLVNKDRPVPKAQTEHKDFKEYQDLTVHKGQLELKEMQGLKVPKASRGSKVQELKAHKEVLDFKEPKGLLLLLQRRLGLRI